MGGGGRGEDGCIGYNLRTVPESRRWTWRTEPARFVSSGRRSAAILSSSFMLLSPALDHVLFWAPASSVFHFARTHASILLLCFACRDGRYFQHSRFVLLNVGVRLSSTKRECWKHRLCRQAKIKGGRTNSCRLKGACGSTRSVIKRGHQLYKSAKGEDMLE